MSVKPAVPAESLPWWFFPALALMSAVSAVLGYTSVHCGGLIAGMLWTLTTSV